MSKNLEKKIAMKAGAGGTPAKSLMATKSNTNEEVEG